VARPFVELVSGSAGVITVVDESEEAALAQSSKGTVLWKANVENRAQTRRKVEFESFVEDAIAAPQAGFAGAHCSFVLAWKRFNQQHQGHRHENYALSCFLLGSVLPLNAAAALVVFIARSRHLHLAKRDPGRSTGCSFHCVVIAKFLVVDLLQQLCAVVYLLAWYEADGLRCQLCLFTPDRCEDASPFGPTMMGALTCMVLSALSNQVLVGSPDGETFSREQLRQDSEGACMRTFARILAGSVSVLPLTTGTFYAGPALLMAPTCVQVVLLVPCILGWMTVAMLFLNWIIACCENCD